MGLKISDLTELPWGSNNNASSTYFPIVLNNGQGLVNRKMALSSIWDIIENNVRSTCEQYRSVYNFGGEGSSGGSSGGELTDDQIAQIATNTQNIQTLTNSYGLLDSAINNVASKVNTISNNKFWIKILDPSNVVTSVYSYSPDEGLQSTSTDSITNQSKVVTIVSGYLQTAKYRYSYQLTAIATYVSQDEKYQVGIGRMILSIPQDQQTQYSGGTINPMQISVNTTWGQNSIVTIPPTQIDDASGQYSLTVEIPATENYLLNQNDTITITVQFGSFQNQVVLNAPDQMTSTQLTGDIT